MKQNIALWQFSGFALSSLFGTILHFLYDWTNENPIVALFSGVNESTWEHIKLLFFPLFVFAFIQSRFFKEFKNFWCVKLFGILAGCVAIPVLFYTYNGIFGKSPDWLNITIFFVSAAMAFYTEYRMFKEKRPCLLSPAASIGILCFIALLFFLFTFFPPDIPFFDDPVTHRNKNS